MIAADRITVLNAAPPRADGEYVLYWMQQSQRAQCNPALEYALEQANDLDLPLLVCLGSKTCRVPSAIWSMESPDRTFDVVMVIVWPESLWPSPSLSIHS